MPRRMHGTARMRNGLRQQPVARDEGVLIDLQSRGYDTMGHAYRQHACSAMSVEEPWLCAMH
jgi:hypothetical protein